MQENQLLEESKLNQISELLSKPKLEILNTALITYIGTRMPPRLKDYGAFSDVTGRSVNILTKGRAGVREIPRRLKKLFQTYENEIINSDLVKYSIVLTQNTINEVLETSSKPTQEKYRKAIYDPNVIYLMFQISIRLISSKLISEGINLSNATMEYYTKMIEANKRKIKDIFISVTNENELIEAKEKYYEILEEHFQDFLDSSLTANAKEIIKIGEEQNILKMVGEESIEAYLEFICGGIQKKFYLAKPLFGEKKLNFD